MSVDWVCQDLVNMFCKGHDVAGSEAAQAASSEKGDQYSLFYKKSRREKDDEKIPEETGRGTAGPARSGA